MDRMEKIRQMLSGDQNDLFLKHALALECIKIGNDQEARLLFEEILQSDPGYIGSYYHLGKLYERENLVNRAEEIYKKGIAAATKAGDTHAANELRSALEDVQ